MDDKIFKEKLSQLVSWYIPIYTEYSKILRKPKNKSDPSDCNLTLGPVVDEIKPCLKECTWCNKIVDQKTIHTLRHYNQAPKKRHWEHKCQTCKKIYDLSGPTPKHQKEIKKEVALARAKASGGFWWNNVWQVIDDSKSDD